MMTHSQHDTQNPNNPNGSMTYASDEIDLRQLVHVLWRRRVSILVIAVLGAALGIAASLYLTRYRSEGLFLIPELTVENYKPYAAALTNRTRLEAFLDLSGQADSAAGKLMQNMIERPGGVEEAMRPAFAFTDKDARQFGVKSDANGIVGLRLVLDERESSVKSPIRLLGEYARDTRIKIDLEEQLQKACLLATTQEQTLRKTQIEDDFTIDQHESMAETLRGIIQSQPNAAQIDNRQVVSLDKDGERFLSPLAQLVAVEVSIANLKLAENKRARDRIATGIRKDYYCQGLEALQNPVRGRDFLTKLAELQSAIVTKQDVGNDAVEATAISLNIERSNWDNKYITGMRFVTSPEGSESRVRKPGLAMGVVLGGMLGGLFGMLLAFLRAWWRDNREVVVAEDS